MIDVWANHWPRRFFDAYPPMQALYERVGIEDRSRLDDEVLTAEMDQAGIVRAIVSATAVEGWPDTNQAVFERCRADPDRLAPCASVDPRRGMAAVRELRRHAEAGAVALKVLPFLYDLPPNDAAYYPLYAACVDLGLPVLILTGHTAVLRRNEVGRPGHLDDVALHFDELTIVAGHAGHPWTDELLGLAWKHECLYLETSGHRPRHFPPALVRYLDGHGRNKVLFGSGY
ncbi:MAG: amidohydrolase family protein, partial [Actinomycetota bacterium]